jgi:hypothetical protein
MPPPLTVRKSGRTEIDYLNTMLEEELTARQRRRTEVLVLYAAGLEGVDIALALDIHMNTVYSDVRAFERYGVDCIHHRLRGGAPIRIAEAQCAEIVRLAEMAPGEVGYRTVGGHYRSYVSTCSNIASCRRSVESTCARCSKKGAARSSHRTQTDQP